MKKILIAIAITLSLSGSFASTEQGVIDYINTTEAASDQKIKAEYVVNSIARIFKEDWSDDDAVFDSISYDINISISCYLHSTEDNKLFNGVNLLDEIQALLTNSEYRIRKYRSFMDIDMETRHVMKKREICNSLI